MSQMHPDLHASDDLKPKLHLLFSRFIASTLGSLAMFRKSFKMEHLQNMSLKLSKLPRLLYAIDFK